MTDPCHFPDPVTDSTCGRRLKGNEHVTLYANAMVYHAILCPPHRRFLSDQVAEFGLRPVGARTADAKRRAVYTGKSGKPFTSAQARAWLIRRGEGVGTAQGRLSKTHIAMYAASH